MCRKRVNLWIASLTGAALLAGCTSEDDKVYKNAELPDRIFVASVQLVEGASIVPGFLYVALDQKHARCCAPAAYKKDYRAYRDAPVGRSVTGKDVFTAVDLKASLYQITVPPPTEPVNIDELLGPLFGGRMRRHVMAEPQEGCIVVSGVRDGILRAGVLANAVEVKTSYVRYGKEQIHILKKINDADVERCNISAVLLLHGLPEAEAMDYQNYAVKPAESYNGDLVPDFPKIQAREAELGKAR